MRNRHSRQRLDDARFLIACLQELPRRLGLPVVAGNAKPLLREDESLGKIGAGCQAVFVQTRSEGMRTVALRRYVRLPPRCTGRRGSGQPHALGELAGGARHVPCRSKNRTRLDLLSSPASARTAAGRSAARLTSAHERNTFGWPNSMTVVKVTLRLRRPAPECGDFGTAVAAHVTGRPNAAQLLTD